MVYEVFSVVVGKKYIDRYIVYSEERRGQTWSLFQRE